MVSSACRADNGAGFDTNELKLATTDRIVLPNGTPVSGAVVRLLWDLWERGVTLEPAGDTGLAVGPSRSLTDDDRIAIRQHCGELRLLLDQEGTEQ